MKGHRQRLFVEGPAGSGKTRLLAAESARLLAAEGQTTLIIAANHARQRQFIARLSQELQKPAAQWPVYTYAGYVRTMLFNYWPLVEAQIGKTLPETGTPRIRPVLSGMEETELLLTALLTQFQNEHPQAFMEFPGSSVSLIRQLVRRIRFRSENALSRKQISDRSAQLAEICQAEVAELEKRFDRASYALRTLDASKQLDVFHSLLEHNPVFQSALRNIKHLVADDLDETTPAQQNFIQWLASNLDTLILAADPDGGSRRGYLNAYPEGWTTLKQLFPGELTSLTRTDAITDTAKTLLGNWLENPAQPKPLPNNVVTKHDHRIARVEMLDAAIDDLTQKIKHGTHPGECMIVLPKTDVLGFYQLSNRLTRRGIPVQLLSGTQRPVDNPIGRAFVCLLQLANRPHWGKQLSLWEIKTLLIRILHCPITDRQNIDTLAQHWHNWQPAEGDTALIPPLESFPETQNSMFPVRYHMLERWLKHAQSLSFEKQLHSAFTQLIATGASDHDRFADLGRMIDGYLEQKQLFSDLETLYPGTGYAETDFDRVWLTLVKTGSIANTPDIPDEINPEAVVIGTPQKIIDTEIRRPHQWWLDTRSREWARSDNAPLYSAWNIPLTKAAESEPVTEETLIRIRAGHLTRTLLLQSTKEIRTFASELDDLGFTHTGMLHELMTPELADGQQPADVLPIVLRDDQQPVLDYQNGTMAVTAVPGAGKTFVNVALIVDLIQRGTPAENMLILTYMDSAAKTLLTRIKHQLTGISNRLPVVSTIHSLAFRILTENDHALRLHLSTDDMVILDDHKKSEVLDDVARATLPESVKNPGHWASAIDRGIAHAKALGLGVYDLETALAKTPGNFRLAEFLPAYRLYQQTLRKNGYLDFTDLILHAIRLLAEHDDIRTHYQKQFQVIIEDEAQDSSKLLQRFIQLLGGDTPNLIRTGDTNQSITTTFSSADTSVFRNFIATADHTVTMDQSSRCAPDVVDLANRWMLLSATQPGLENAFQHVAIRPVQNQNPDLIEPLRAERFELSNEEDQWLSDEIRRLKHAHPDATIAVLVRSNSQVNHLTGLLQHAEIPAISHSEQLNLNPVFQVVLSLLKTLEHPGDLKLQFALYESLVHAQRIPHTLEHKTFFETQAIAYANPDELHDETLLQLYYDVLEFSRDAAGGNIPTLIIKIIDRLFESVADKSNGYLCALMAEEVLRGDIHSSEYGSPLETVITRFEDLKKSFRGKKSFSELLTQHPARFVHVMSLHKSKGQEFDVVFMPYLQRDSFPHDVGMIRFDETDKLQQELDKIAASGSLPDDAVSQKKREKIEEEARLVYVGLTRAKRALFLSSHTQEITRYGKVRPVEPSFAFETLTSLCESKEEVPIA